LTTEDAAINSWPFPVGASQSATGVVAEAGTLSMEATFAPSDHAVGFGQAFFKKTVPPATTPDRSNQIESSKAGRRRLPGNISEKGI
jgi:hypothetical protein